MVLRGISGVVIAVLLTVIGIAAVLMFWGIFGGIIQSSPRLVVESATITKIGNQYELTIHVREVGGASTQIIRIEILGGDQPISITPSQGAQSSSQGTQGTKIEIGAGESRTITHSITNQELKPGMTYYIRLIYQKGDREEPTDLYPVSVR